MNNAMKRVRILPLLLAGWLAAAATTAQADPGAAPASQAPAALPPNAVSFTQARFSDLVAYKPEGQPRSFAMFLSGEGGWDAASAAMAQDLVKNSGAMVVGLDTPRYMARLESEKSDCEYSDGDLEFLSHYTQAYFKLPTYLPPILVGEGQGAALAYADLAVAPSSHFGGAVLMGLCPGFDLRKPLCKRNDLQYNPRAGGKGGVELLPAKSLTSPLTVLLDAAAGASCPAATSRAFVTPIGNASLVEAPATAVAHDAPPQQRYPGFRAAYDRMVEALAPTVPIPPASLEGLPVIEVPAKPGVPEAPVFAIVLSGDGGWAGLDRDLAATLSSEGVPVVGVDSLRYFWTPRTPESAAADTDRIIRYYLSHWHKKQVLLAGYSQGADVLPFIINRLPPPIRSSVAVGAMMGLSEHALFEFHLGNWVNANQGQGLPTAPEMERASDIPMLCMYGEDESDTICPKLDPKKVRVIKFKGGHHFGGDYSGLARQILANAGLAQVAAAAPDAGTAPVAEGGPVESAGGATGAASLQAVLMPLLSLLAGILILLLPRRLKAIVAIYLVATGVLGLLQHFFN